MRTFYHRHVSTHLPDSSDFREDVDDFLACFGTEECPCSQESRCVDFVLEKLTDGTVFIREER